MLPIIHESYINIFLQPQAFVLTHLVLKYVHLYLQKTVSSKFQVSPPKKSC